jgi:hypothetical protein
MLNQRILLTANCKCINSIIHKKTYHVAKFFLIDKNLGNFPHTNSFLHRIMKIWKGLGAKYEKRFRYRSYVWWSMKYVMLNHTVYEEASIFCDITANPYEFLKNFSLLFHTLLHWLWHGNPLFFFINSLI